MDQALAPTRPPRVLRTRRQPHACRRGMGEAGARRGSHASPRRSQPAGQGARLVTRMSKNVKSLKKKNMDAKTRVSAESSWSLMPLSRSLPTVPCVSDAMRSLKFQRFRASISPLGRLYMMLPLIMSVNPPLSYISILYLGNIFVLYPFSNVSSKWYCKYKRR